MEGRLVLDWKVELHNIVHKVNKQYKWCPLLAIILVLVKTSARLLSEWIFFYSHIPQKPSHKTRNWRWAPGTWQVSGGFLYFSFCFYLCGRRLWRPGSLWLLQSQKLNLFLHINFVGLSHSSYSSLHTLYSAQLCCWLGRRYCSSGCCLFHRYHSVDKKQQTQ